MPLTQGTRMKQSEHVGRYNRDFVRGRYPWHIRPAGIGVSKTKLCWADVTVTGSNLGDVTQVFYGDTVTPTGDPLPKEGTTGIFAYITPLSAQWNTTYDGPGTVGLVYNGGGQFGLTLYKDADRWDFGLLDYKIVGYGLSYGEFNNFGGGRGNMEGDDTFRGNGVLVHFADAQSWAKPWTPNKVGLALSITHCTASVTLRITFVWTTT